MNLYELNSLKTFITLLKSVELSQVIQNLSEKKRDCLTGNYFFFNMEFEVTEKMIMHDYFPIRKKKLIKI